MLIKLDERKIFTQGQLRPLHCSQFLTGMLTRDLLAAANLVRCYLHMVFCIYTWSNDNKNRLHYARTMSQPVRDLINIIIND